MPKLFHAHSLAWQHVKERKGAAGVDGTEIAMYLQWINPRWDNIKRRLEQGNYCPQPVKRVEIPKSNGDIPMVRACLSASPPS